MMKVVTANVNGIRAAGKKGFFDWLLAEQAFAVCVQETKAQRQQLTDELYDPKGYYCYYHDAEKKGYSGVALYCQREPDNVITGMGDSLLDSEGRYIEAQFGSLSIISLYMPSGSSGEVRQQIKYDCMAIMLDKMRAFKASGRDYIICGDWNIAHTQEDIRNWKGNLKNSGFLPEERAWMDTVLSEEGFVDAFRELKQAEHEYTWWSNRGQARANNVGWRIDYQILSPSLRGCVRETAIYRAVRFSDHAPLTINYDYVLS